MQKRAVILAGGQGTRLKPYTIVLPKPLVPVGNLPIMEILLNQLKSAGFTHITIAVNHLAEIIMAYFQDGKKWGITIDYSIEDKPLSTMGPLKLIKDLPDNFLIMNGDVLTDLNFAAFMDNHLKEKRLFSISSFIRTDKSEYGVLNINADSELTEFKEKPEYSFQVSMGIYAVNKKIMDYIPEHTFFGFDHLMYKLLEEKQPVKVIPHQGIWLDIGRPTDYQLALDTFESDPKKFMP
jgi:NDP-sugar pyrophosphorylase family protein